MMPGINGEDQTGVEYSPHLYVLAIDGDETNDNDYHFVGNTQVCHEMDVDPSFFSLHQEKEYREGKARVAYSLGVSVLGKLVADQGIYEVSAAYLHSKNGIALEAVPREVRVNYLSEAIERMGGRDTHPMLAACGIESPLGIKPITIDDYLNDTPPDFEERKSAWDIARAELREKHFPGWATHWEYINKKFEEDSNYDADRDVDYDLSRFESHGLTFIDESMPFNRLNPQH